VNQWTWNITQNNNNNKKHNTSFHSLYPQDALHYAAHTQQVDREHYKFLYPRLYGMSWQHFTVSMNSEYLAKFTLGGNVAIVVLIKWFYGESTLCTSLRFHFKLNAIHGHATWQHHSPSPLKLKIEKRRCQIARFTGGPGISWHFVTIPTVWDICRNVEWFHWHSLTVCCILSSLVKLPWWWWWSQKRSKHFGNKSNVMKHILYMSICWFRYISLNILGFFCFMDL